MTAQLPTKSAAFREIASAIGRDAACRLVEKLGGSRVYVPREPGEDHELTKAIGEEAARRLGSFFHGTCLTLPTLTRAHKRRLVRELAQGGTLTRAAIARETDYTERQVYRILGEEGG